MAKVSKSNCTEKLTGMQEKFCKEYLKDFNQKQAAIRPTLA